MVEIFMAVPLSGMDRSKHSIAGYGIIVRWTVSPISWRKFTQSPSAFSGLELTAAFLVLGS